MAAKQKNPEDILQQVVEISDPAEQQAFLAEACEGDEALRTEVESLLSAYAESGDFLDVPALDPDITMPSKPLSEEPGTLIGRYKLLEKIGEGGMATVYMAEQKRPIRRRVALKLIKLGMDSKQVIGRFEAERQALALMDHPNISKVLDAGSTETGRPYFVMELVRGLSITEFCDSNHLTTQERLQLFTSVCNAVHHAHQKGIIHRDIKPSNIMVTLHDGEPVVKVIDFGIAKAVNQQLTEKTIFTRYAQMIGTPEYMSPEQAEMSGLDIDTRTDVFSLGVLLYELLTGSTPFNSEYLLSKGYNEMQRIIREEEPVRPSTKISTLGEALTAVAKHRRTSPELLCKLVRTDLDWIVMKTLEKDRSRRYESVNELAAEVKRHLDNEPVLAGRPSAAYRMQKFVRRNRVLVGSLTAIAVIVLLAAAISSVQAIRATKAKRVAEMATQAETEQRQEAEQARNDFETLSKLQEKDIYFNHIRLAHQELEANRPVHALDLLEKCPKDLRNWEWHYLQRKGHFKKTPQLEFEDKVITFAQSPDGSISAAFLANGKLVFRDRSGRQQGTYHVRENLEQLAEDYKDWLSKWVAFSPDGKYVAVAVDDHAIDVISLASHEVARHFDGHTDTVTRIVWSPNEFLLASVSEDKTICLWDRRKEGPLRRLTFDFKPINLAFTGDGNNLFVTNLAGSCERYKVRDILNEKEPECITNDLGSSPFGITVSPDGQRIAIGLWNGSVLLADIAYTETMELKGPVSIVQDVVFNIDGTRLAAISDDLSIRLWDTETGREILVIGRSDPFAYDIQFSKDGHELFVSDRQKTVKVFDASPINEARESKTMELAGHRGTVSTLFYSPTGEQLISCGKDGTVRIWRVSDGEQIESISLGTTTVHWQYSPNGQWITGWSVQQGRFVNSVWEASPPFNEYFKETFNRETAATAFSHDSNYLLIGGEEQVLRVYDLQLKKEIGILGSQNDYIVSLDVSPEGKYIASTGYRGNVKIWDAERLNEPQQGRLVYEGGLAHFSAGFSSDGKLLAVGGREGEIVVLDPETGEHVFTIPRAHGDIVNNVSFDPTGKFLVSSGFDSTVRIWNTETREQVDILLEHKGRVFAPASSPDGKHVASAGDDGIIRIWTPRLD